MFRTTAGRQVAAALSVVAALSLALLAAPRPARADTVFFTNTSGQVGAYNTLTNVAAPVGSLFASGFVGLQVVGLAYNPGTDTVIIFDRNASRVYAMNATTGFVFAPFDPGYPFQGGAFRGGLIYGINEETQTVEAITPLGIDINLISGPLDIHSHALGVDPVAGQLYGADNTGTGIYRVNPDGSQGANVVSTSSGLVKEDIDYYGGDFLVAGATAELLRVNGTTGVVTQYLTPAQIAAGGVAGEVTGVVVRLGGSIAGPEPGALALLILPVVGTAVARCPIRRRQRVCPA